ncbi:HPr-rel-A system PqqD family peptide chaperone [Candidatus Eisenbacteria bacterium]|uniref:HPr-rel-A system PqqD family peptide chaperone n=1 Tax=Eiseniibacteriota bacterium TaxID=2212470 RepID=A0ABV6YIR7_UNCEI
MTRPLRKNSLLIRRMGEETVLYDRNTGAIHTLNPTALLIWDLCDGKHALEDMEQAIRKQFSVGETETVLADIRDVLSHFREEGLLVDP